MIEFNSHSCEKATRRYSAHFRIRPLLRVMCKGIMACLLWRDILMKI
jgi:hypothetical protein